LDGEMSCIYLRVNFESNENPVLCTFYIHLYTFDIIKCNVKPQTELY